jgi:hypothetical protein
MNHTVKVIENNTLLVMENRICGSKVEDITRVMPFMEYVEAVIHLRKYARRVWTGLIWLKTGTSGGVL